MSWLRPVCQSSIRSAIARATLAPLLSPAEVKLRDVSTVSRTASITMIGNNTTNVPATRRTPNRLRANRNRSSSAAIMSTALLGDRSNLELSRRIGQIADGKPHRAYLQTSSASLHVLGHPGELSASPDQN